MRLERKSYFRVKTILSRWMVQEAFSDEATGEGIVKERIMVFSTFTLTVPFIQYAGYTFQFNKYHLHDSNALP